MNKHRLANLYIGDQPHLYPLARVLDEFPTYAVLLADTHSARIFVVASQQIQQTDQVDLISGATDSSDAYAQAVQTALAKAE